MTDKQSDIGLIGLAVMGQNLALNIADHGFRISVFNRTTSKMESFVADNPKNPISPDEDVPRTTPCTAGLGSALPALAGLQERLPDRDRGGLGPRLPPAVGPRGVSRPFPGWHDGGRRGSR